MANYTGTVAGKGQAFAGAVDALNTNSQISEAAGGTTAMRNALLEAAKVIGVFDAKASLTATGTWTLYTGVANPSCSVSVTV